MCVFVCVCVCLRGGELVQRKWVYMYQRNRLFLFFALVQQIRTLEPELAGAPLLKEANRTSDSLIQTARQPLRDRKGSSFRLKSRLETSDNHLQDLYQVAYAHFQCSTDGLIKHRF
jgi:hypothetical protein